MIFPNFSLLCLPFDQNKTLARVSTFTVKSCHVLGLVVSSFITTTRLEILMTSDFTAPKSLMGMLWKLGHNKHSFFLVESWT